MGHLEVVGLEGTSISRLVLATLAVRKLNLFIYLFIYLAQKGGEGADCYGQSNEISGP